MKQQIVQYWHRSGIYWIFNGKNHRDGDLPARYYFKDGKLYSVSYHQHGVYHRTNGPAYINYKDKIKGYFYQGTEYASLEKMLMLEACR